MPKQPPPFRPYPLLASGHLQTLAACYLFDRPHLPNTVQHRIALEDVDQNNAGEHDSDQLVLHDDRPAHWHQGDPVAMLVHGLCGNHQSRYIVRVTGKLLDRGVRTFRLDLRGCGAGEGLARTFTHCGRHTDIEPPIARIAQLAPNSPLTVCGFSLGAALALNLAATNPSLPNWTNTVAVCPPVDLAAVERLLQRPVNKQYDRFFARRLWQMVVRHSHNVAGAPAVDHLTPPRRLREFDELYTVPLGGYLDADDYYRQASVISRLDRIKIRTRIIASANDPIVPIGPLLGAKLARNTQLLSTHCGGHLGFVGRRGSDPDRHWLDWRIIEWVLGKHPINPGGVPLRHRSPTATTDRQSTALQ